MLPLQISLKGLTELLSPNKRLVFFVGGYGSGKTEVAVNYALHWSHQTTDLSLVDLDIVNPYFRSREQAQLVSRAGIKVIAPAGALATADLPAVPPEIIGVIQDTRRKAVFDIGGDETGARVLGRFHHLIPQHEYEMWFVFNACRPFSRAVEPTVALLHAIEKISRLSVTGLVNNTNLMQFTDLSLLQRGEALAFAVGEAIGVPLVMNTVACTLVDKAAAQLSAPILPLQLFMKRPWE